MELNDKNFISVKIYSTFQLCFFCRRKQAVEDLAVKPVTQFPVEISNEDAFSSFKNVRNVTIKKVKNNNHHQR